MGQAPGLRRPLRPPRGRGERGNAIIEIMPELVFEVTQEPDGEFCAECVTVDIFTQGDTWEELRANVRQAVRAFYFDAETPKHIRLHLVKDETLASTIANTTL